MVKNKILLLILSFSVLFSGSVTFGAETWLLDENQNWQNISTDTQYNFLTAIAEIKTLIDEGETDLAYEAFEALKQDYPEIAGEDMDIYIKAELLLSRKKLTKAARNYDKLLTNYPGSSLRAAAAERLFTIGSEYLEGRKKVVLGFIRISGRAEGIRILEKVIEHAGIESMHGTQAALALAKNYEERELFNDAFLKWWEISLQWQSGTIGRDALLGMARTKNAIYNKNPEDKREFYDASCLRSAKSYYERFRLYYSEEAESLGIDAIIEQIDEQLAYKEFRIGQYYQRTGKQQAANLYFNMVVSNWPESQAAQKAKEMLDTNINN